MSTPTPLTPLSRLDRLRASCAFRAISPYGNARLVTSLFLLAALLLGCAAVDAPMPDAHAAAALAAAVSAASPSPAPLLAGETLWNGVPSDLYGLGDTYDYIGASGFDHSATIQAQVKAAHVPLIRAFFETVDETDHTTLRTDAQQLVIAQAIANTGAACMANLTQPVTVTQALHLVSILAPYCRYFEVYNEPDLDGTSAATYLAFWNSFVPQARAEDPTALFGGPALSCEYGNVAGDDCPSQPDSHSYMEQILTGMAASGVAPDFVTFHFYICGDDPQSQCLADAANYTPGHGKSLAALLAQDFPGKRIPLGITEWSANSGNPQWAYDDAFMAQFEQAALSGFAQNPYLSFATQFDIGSYAGYGTLDLFRTDSGEPYTQTPAAVGSARPLFGVLASQIATQQSGGAAPPTPSPTSTPPAPSPTSAPSATPSPPPPATLGGVPRYAHVITIVMENHGYSSIIGDTTDAPYINGTLAQQGALATNFQAEVASSLPNYMALTGGTTLGWTANCEPQPTPANGVGPCPGGLSSGPSIMSEASAAGLSWRAYAENMGSGVTCLNAVDGGVGGLYTVHHNPAAYYSGLASACQTNDVDYAQLASDLTSPTSLPSYVFITPNLTDDMHNGTVSQGDSWLAQAIPAIQQSAACAGTTAQSHCLIAVTWDESDDASNEQVATLLVGPDVAAGARDATAYNHYALLHTEEAALGMGTLTSNDANAPLMLGMFSGGSSPAPTPTPSPSPTPSPTPPPPSGSTLFSDTFDGDPVGAPPAGWTLVSGNWDVEIDASAGGAQRVLQQTTSPEASSYITAGSPGWTDYTLTAQVRAAGGSGLTGTYNLMGRYTDANNHYSLILKNGDEWWLGYKQGGSWTTLANGTFAYNATTWYTFSLAFSGRQISASINGKTLASVTDATFGHGAIGWNTNAAGELDNVSVVAPGGTGGSPTPTPTPVPPTPTPSPSPTPSPQPINNVSCTVVIGGVSEQGVCSGSFTPQS